MLHNRSSFIQRRLALARTALTCVVIAFWVPAGSAQEVVVGQLASLSHPQTRRLAQEYNAGIELAFLRTNAAGGVQGRRLRLQLMDDHFDPAQTATLAQELVDRYGAVALLGGLGTPTTMRLITDGFMERNRIGNFAPLTGLPEAQAAAHVFPVRATFNDEVKAMFAHAASLGRKRVAFVYYRAGAGPALSKLVPQWCDDARLQLTANIGFTSERDAAKELAAIDQVVGNLGDTRPDAVVLIAFGAAHSAAVKSLRQRYGAWMPVYSLGQVNLEDLLAQAGADAARGVSLTQVMPSPMSGDQKIVRDFAAERLKWKPQMPATYVGLEGYVAGRVVVELMKRARPLSREGVLAAAYAAGEMDVAGFRVRYGADVRKSLHPVDVTLIDRDGRLIH